VSRSADAISDLVASQLAAVPDQDCRNRLAQTLVPPRLQPFAWEYGALDATYTCGVVAELPGQNLVLVYCEEGFGKHYPWGVIDLATGSMGRDDSWFGSFYDAAIGAGFCVAPDGYEVP
jgi:hypothetical protein